MEITYGFCHCGCGNRTPLYSRSDKSSGRIKGQPAKFIRYHWKIKSRHRVVQPENKKLRIIALTKGQQTIVSAHRYEKFMLYAWSAYWSTTSKSFYAVRGTSSGGKINTIAMHHEILPPKKGHRIDHKNRNTLDNRDRNIRYADNSQSNANRKVGSLNTSGYTGVDWMRKLQKWRARVKWKGVIYHAGVFAKKMDAVRARARKAAELFGEFNPS